MCIKQKGNSIYLDQTAYYLEKVPQQFGMVNTKVSATPLPAGYVPLENKGKSDPGLQLTYQSVIGSLLYIMLGTQPNITYTVTKLAQFAANPSQEHLDKVLYTCHCLAGTKDYVLGAIVKVCKSNMHRSLEYVL